LSIGNEIQREELRQAKELAATKGLQMMDVLSEVGYNDPAMTRRLARKALSGGG